MANVHLDLQAGFKGDTVVVRAGGREISRREDVTTNYSIGRADSARLEVPSGSVELEIAVPGKHLSTRVALDPASTPFLGVSVVGDRIEHRSSATPFEYF